MPSHDTTTVRKTVDVVGDGERKPFDAVIPFYWSSSFYSSEVFDKDGLLDVV